MSPIGSGAIELPEFYTMVNTGPIAKGSYSYTDPDGSTITVNWVGDENGFLPTGGHLPAAFKIPEAPQMFDCVIELPVDL